ncbi:molybdenum ABC transporter ATP-binding protein [Sulfitobacter sp. S190]|uniref:molybdenum ABC transporter ATP-binding protein n=1 Tax=Sulfitobacter sp. S190 TaxID=2867022 RepID=UPI0021A578FD|nr:molybdenum ABC transporter ATP-binding protein [Sulfitobacter sp. S190]UWR23431.1 molybdenum ABC transporter ATP-binding protein [Sulfitobacter sp. S190]
MKLHLTHRFDGFDLDIALDAGPGITALFGRSGAGKSTVIKAIAGLLRPDHGLLQFGDQTLLDTARGIHVPAHKRRFGTVFQDARLFPHLDVAANLDFGTRYAPAGTSVARDDVIALLGLGDLLARKPGALSGGERQRVALGRALLSAPRMLLMDEPLASLDAPRKAEILPYLEGLRDGPLKLPILYVSHAMEEITRLADHLVLIRDGRVAAQGPIATLMADPAAAPLLGVREAGAVIEATVVSHADDGLSLLRFSGGTLDLPGVRAAVGSAVRLRIMAHDVMLARARPEGLSAQNILPATIADIRAGDGPGTMVVLRLGADTLLARITARAAAALDLAVGQQCFAILKATTVAPGSIGR